VQENYSRIGSAEIDRLFDDGIQELDRSKATAIANQADTLIWQEVHSLSLYQRPDLWACRQGLANFGATGFADLVYQDIGWAK
jgi:peptide/nickel transport system substrate-binding protein